MQAQCPTASFMPDHTRWFATSAEGLAGVDAVAERLFFRLLPQRVFVLKFI